MVKQVLWYETKDGERFDSRDDAYQHESELIKANNKAIRDYLANQHRGEKHDNNTYGYWEVFGENPNADYAGFGTAPKLGIVQGKFINVLTWAINQPRWFTHGAGGEIRRIKIEEAIKV